VNGTVMETPNHDDRVPRPDARTAFPVQEAGGIVWAYLGPKD